MALNPYKWSPDVNFTVNISLISVILMISILFHVYTEKFSWEYCHEWMKINSEVATNITLESRSSCMRKFLDIPVVRKLVKVVKILVTVLLGLWPAGNI